MEKTYAVIADVHGNSWALDAVIADLQDRAVDTILNLGDHVFGPLDPAGTAETLMKLNAVNISGNQDRAILEAIDEGTHHPTMQFVLTQITKEHIEWLKNHPPANIIDKEILLCHGSPDSDVTYLLEDISSGTARLKQEPQIKELLQDETHPVILCGHTHIPRAVLLEEKTLVINPGSVGLPAYDDNEPLFHKMETGSPYASYALLKKSESDWNVDIIKIAYDREAAANSAEKNGRADWAKALRTGRA